MKFNLKPANEEQSIEWVSWTDEIKKVGDGFKIQCSKLIFKAEPSPVFFVIDEENNVGISAYCTNHPDSPFPNATPHGVRLVNALGRHFDFTGEVDVAEILEAVSKDIHDHNDPFTVQIDKTEKGVLWSIVS